MQEIYIHIKYIGKTEVQWDLFVLSLWYLNNIYSNLFADYQTK